MFLSLLHINLGNHPDRPGHKWLNNVYRVHQRLWMAFPDDERLSRDPFFLNKWDIPALPDPKPPRSDAGFMFRIEREGKPRILVQSRERPDWEYAFQNAPYLLAEAPQMRELDPDPRQKCMYRFRLLANVVRRKSETYPDGRTRTTGSGMTIHRRRRIEIPIILESIPDPLPIDPPERNRILRARWDPWRLWIREMGARNGFRIVDESSSTLRMESVRVSLRNPGKERGGSGKLIDKRYNGGLFEGVLVCTDPIKLRTAVLNGIGHAKAFGFGLLSLAPFARSPDAP